MERIYTHRFAEICEHRQGEGNTVLTAVTYDYEMDGVAALKYLTGLDLGESGPLVNLRRKRRQAWH